MLKKQAVYEEELQDNIEAWRAHVDYLPISILRLFTGTKGSVEEGYPDVPDLDYDDLAIVDFGAAPVIG